MKETTELKHYLSSGYSVIQLESWEEERALRRARAAAEELSWPAYVWSASRGFGDHTGTGPADPMEALRRVEADERPGLFIFLDFHHALKDPAVARLLRELAPNLDRRRQGVVLIGPVSLVPIEMDKEIVVIDLPPPGRDEMRRIVDECLGGDGKLLPELREAVVRAAQGLTARETRRMLRRAREVHPDFGLAHVRDILDEKRRALRRSEMLEFYDTDRNLEDLGGLDMLKKWLTDRAEAFGERARAYGLPEPRGLLLLGVQGCGKSLSAKAVAGLWGIPLIRLDLSAVVGDSEGGQLRRSLRLSESLAPCVLWIDEIEKGFSAHRVSGEAEQGQMARAFATFLTWLQEKQSPVYVIATANSISELPPELVRKGRFDDIFFVDLPREVERVEIFRIHLVRRRRKPAAFDLVELARNSEGFSGSEIEQAVVSAMYEAFTANREFETADVMRAVRETVPLSQTMEEQIKALRDWAKTRARPASFDTTLMDLLNKKS